MSTPGSARQTSDPPDGRHPGSGASGCRRGPGLPGPGRGHAPGRVRQLDAVSSPSSSGGSAAGQTITLYNGQHEQTTDALVAAFEKKTGITVKVRSDDEDVLANQIITEGSGSPADVIYTENSPALETLQEKGRLSRGRPVDPGRGAGEVQLAPGQVGGGVGPGQRHGLQHRPTVQGRPAHLGHGSSPIPSGRARSAWPRGSRTSSPSSSPSRRPTAPRRRRRGSPPSRPTPGGTSIPTTRH